MPTLHQGVLDRVGYRALSRTRESGKPHKRTFLAEQILALFASHVSFVPNYVRRFDLSQ